MNKMKKYKGLLTKEEVENSDTILINSDAKIRSDKFRDYVFKKYIKEDGNLDIETPNRILEKDGSEEIHNKNTEKKTARYFGGGRATLKIWDNGYPDDTDPQYNDKVDVPTKAFYHKGKNGENQDTSAFRVTSGNVFVYIGQMLRSFVYKIQIYFNGGKLLIGDGQGLEYEEGNTKVYLKSDGKHTISCLSRKVSTGGGTYLDLKNSGIELYSQGEKSDGTVTTSRLKVTNSRAEYAGESFTFKGADPKRDTDPTGGSSLVNKKYVDSVKETVDGLIGSVPCDEYIQHTAYSEIGRAVDNDFYGEYFDGIVITPYDQGDWIGVTNYDYLIEHTAVGEKTFVVEILKSESGHDYDYDMYISVHEVDENGDHSIKRQEILPELVYYICKGLYKSDLAFPGANNGVINCEKGYYKFTTVPNYNYSGSFNGHSYTGRVAGTKYSNTESNPVEEAQGTAENARRAAESAITTANRASRTASDASDEASSAQQTADNATAKANLAVKMATNSLVGITPKIVYKKYSSSEYTIETGTLFADDESILKNADTEEVVYLDCTNLTTLSGFTGANGASRLKRFAGAVNTANLKGIDEAFQGSKTIETVDLTASTFSGDMNYTFFGASKLTKFVWPRAGWDMLRISLPFYGTSLTEIIFPRNAVNLKMIAQQSFAEMRYVTLIDISQTTAVFEHLGVLICSNCVGLQTFTIPNADFVNITRVFDWQGQPVYSATNLFNGCYSLVNFSGFKNFKLSYSLQDSPLSHESAMNCINGLYDLTEGGTVTDYTPQTLTFKRSTYDTLTDEEIAIATEKGWNLASY